MQKLRRRPQAFLDALEHRAHAQLATVRALRDEKRKLAAQHRKIEAKSSKDSSGSPASAGTIMSSTVAAQTVLDVSLPPMIAEQQSPAEAFATAPNPPLSRMLKWQF